MLVDEPAPGLFTSRVAVSQASAIEMRYVYSIVVTGVKRDAQYVAYVTSHLSTMM